MSNSKKLKKYDKIDIPAQSLVPPDKDGYLTKQGGGIKTWKKRYFILKGPSLYYYKSPKDTTITGRVDLESGSIVREEKDKKTRPNMFSVQTAKRIFYISADRTEEMNEWMGSIKSAIDKVKGTPGTPASQSASSSAVTPADRSKSSAQTPAGTEMSPRVRLALAKSTVSFLKDEESKVLEFWQIWSESIPAKEEIGTGMSIDFFVATSADMQKLTWRTSGPQNIFIQKMVDFFWNVGAPESEIDRLNDVGALINPVKIGSWIDMSAKGGMDGGWYFPVDIPLKLAVEAADAGEAITKFTQWGESHDVMTVFTVGRDMGAAPPRQTELRMKLPGADYDAQWKLGVDAFSAFGFPAIPDNALAILKNSRVNVTDHPLCLSVITSSEGFVRLGLLVPKPNTQTVLQLCSIAGGNNENIAAFEGSLGALGSDGPTYAEYQYLMKGFGYGVYKEGFDIVFHYSVGSETL